MDVLKCARVTLASASCDGSSAARARRGMPRDCARRNLLKIAVWMGIRV